MNILLCNDDGMDSEALATLCRAAAARRHHVTVCAPDTQQSGKSHSFTVFEPLLVRPAQMEGAEAAYRVAGTPADCARLGMLSLCPQRPDLVVSGINVGYNAGLSTYLSGTVGAAREAAFMDIPALAVSMAADTPRETLCFLADWAMRLGERLVHYPRPKQAVCNVNVPGVLVHELHEPRMCPISTIPFEDTYQRRISPRGDLYFWLDPEHERPAPAPNTDLDYLSRSHITCTMLTPEPCDQEAWADLLTDL